MRKLQKKWPKIDPQLLEALSQKIASELGLSFSKKLSDLEKILIKYFNEFKTEKLSVKVKQLLQANLLQEPNLINLLTIPETYFFRNYRLFKALEQSILPGMLEQKVKNGEALTIWSAGCSSGEEPYSFAMLIDDMREKLNLNLELRILGTDLNHQSLAKARRGVYSNWSFRKIPVKYLEKYFKPLDERFYKIDEKIRHAVTFQHHNLKQGPYPPSPKWTQFDLIVCRNVLIYFDKETSFEVLNNFSKVLKDEGIFILGPAEMPSLYFKQFKPQLINDLIVYRKNGFVLHKSATNKSQGMNRLTVTSRKPKKLKIEKRLFQLPNNDKHESVVENSVDEKALIKKLADQGELQEALQLAKRYVERKPMEEEAHYLLGTIYFEIGELDKAKTSFEKTLYLKPDFLMAYFHLANISSMQSNQNNVLKYFSTMLDLLNHYPADQSIPFSDGLTAGQFRKLVGDILETEKVAG